MTARNGEEIVIQRRLRLRARSDATYIPSMARWAVILGAVLLVVVIAAAIVPMWIATAGMGMSAAGYSAVVLMIIFCFAVGGGLMFLIFYSARKGYDDAVHHGARSDREQS